MEGIIKSVTEDANDYGPYKKAVVGMADGSEHKVFTSDKAKAVYPNLAVGAAVELELKRNGQGYLIKRVLPQGHTPRPSSAAPAAAAVAVQPWYDMTGEDLKERTEKALKIMQYVHTKTAEAGFTVVEAVEVFKAVIRQ
jgi:hypothetical protein